MNLRRWQRGVLYGVGAWTAFGGVSALLDPSAHCETFFGDASLADGGAMLLFRLAYLQLIAWGAGYALAARFPSMLVPILGGGALGKLIYAASTLAAYGAGQATFAFVLTGIGDAVIALFFAYLIASSPRALAMEGART